MNKVKVIKLALDNGFKLKPQENLSDDLNPYGYDFAQALIQEATRDQFHLYQAEITRVVDGDTVDAMVDLGFKVKMAIRFRLSGFDAPETYRPSSKQEKRHGLLATKALEELIEGKTITIKSNKFGKYRYLAEIFTNQDVKSVNQMMVELGHVKRETYEVSN